MTESYGSSTVKRSRSTKAQLADLDTAIFKAVADDNPVTLRGVFYRVMSAGAVEKTENGYRAVGRRLLALRRDGRVPYSYITDGTRYVIQPRTHRDVETMLADAAASYRRALWNDQNVEVHIFTEKDAISGVISPITKEWDVPLGILRGYASESFVFQMARAVAAADCPVFVYQLGDHDPSGVNAWEDFQRKVRGFAPDAEVEFTRLAVTEDQIATLNLPTRPTKKSDSRAAKFTGESVEVDAIPANILRRIVENAVVQHIDARALELTFQVEDQERQLLTSMIDGGWSR